MTVVYGNWNDLQKIIPVTSTPVEVPFNYEFQKNECSYIPSMTYTKVLRADRIPTEFACVDALKSQIEKEQGARLLYCNATLTKTVDHIAGDGLYYKVDVEMKDVVIQADIFVLILITIIVVSITVGGIYITTALTMPAVIYKIMGISPEEVDAYNEAQAKLWGVLTNFMWSLVGLVAVGFTGLGVYTILKNRGRNKEKG